MDIEKITQFIEMFEDLTDDQRRFVYANLNHIIQRFNDKYNKNISIRF